MNCQQNIQFYLICVGSANIQMKLEEVLFKTLQCRFAESVLQNDARCIDVKNPRIFTKQLILKFTIIRATNGELPKR